MIITADVKWIKLDVDMFSNPKVKRLRRLPDGNNMLLIWVMLLTMAGKCNASGMIFITQNIPYTVEDLADELGFSVDTVKLALRSLENLGMITTNENYDLEITNWCEHQSNDRLDEMREKQRSRQQRYREKQKQLQIEQKCDVTGDVTGDVTPSISISISNSYSISNIYKEVIDYLNNILNSNYRYNSTKTQNLIKARVNEGYTIVDFKRVIEVKVAEWKGTDMEKYLRPETLFGNKFEGYLNQKSKGVKSVERTTDEYGDGGIGLPTEADLEAYYADE